jgi:superfamily II DNA/RNA helicase
VLSEGVNLQQARHIINYDLPWNPMRLVQRHGRIDRIGSDHAEVFIRCYFPDQHLEALLGLEERLQRKLKQAAAAVGVGQVLPGFTGREVTFTEARTRSPACAAKKPPSSKKAAHPPYPARSTGAPSNVNSPTRPPRRQSWTCRGEPEPGSSAPARNSPASCSAPASPTTRNHGSAISP